MKLFKQIFTMALLTSVLLFSCAEEEDPGPMPTGNSKTYSLASAAVPGISGTAKFIENDDNTVTIELDLLGTTQGGTHPAHIHLNTAAEGGGIALTLGSVDGGTGKGSITIDKLDDETSISYSELLDFDGYINVHLSTTELGTIVAQGDIGQNELTGTEKSYALASVAVPDISGSVTFSERVNGEALAVIELSNTPEGGSHPAHIHTETAAEGGGIAFTFNPVNGDDGISKTNVSQLDAGSTFGYADVLDFDGYVNVHLSADDLGTLVAQGDIGQNELTGVEKSYALASVAVPDISGSVTFSERVNGEALAVIELSNTPEGGSHPAHIHTETAAEGGGIAFTFNPVNGDDGISKTNVSQLDAGSTFEYADVLAFDGYVNVHLSADDLGTLVAQGDIGQNELTGESVSYDLDTKDVPGINGTVEFAERLNGTTLITIILDGTPDEGEHPAHIHANDASTGGGILVTLNSVNGTTGMSKTQVAALDGGILVSYTEFLDFDGYINVHLSSAELSVIVAQGNIGSNAGEPTPVNYDVVNSGSSAYLFTGNGLSSASNPDITLKRGTTYTFEVNASGHPFFINSVQGTGTANAYNDGVTNNGASVGTVTFTVPSNAPNTLFYNCQFHGSMTGTFTITD